MAPRMVSRSSGKVPTDARYEVLHRLFIARFNAAYPKGLNVRKSSRRLNLEYRSASGAFTVNLFDRFPSLILIDPDGSTGPLKIAADIAADCTEALDGYSRQIGRNPQSVGSVGARMLLPQELRSQMSINPDVQRLKAAFAALLEKSITQISIAELLRLTGLVSATDTRKPTATAIRLSEVLAHLDIGMEPDNRYGGKLSATSSLVTIFKAPGGAAIDPLCPEYASARVLAEVAVLAASVDGNDEKAGLRSILDEVERLPGISSPERLRLFAYVLSLVNEFGAFSHGLIQKRKRTKLASAAPCRLSG